MNRLKVIEQTTKGLFAFHPANGGYRTPVEAAILKSMGVRAGVPDIIIHFKGGKSIFIELKSGKGRLSDHQKTVHEILKGFGYRVEVISADTPMDAVKQLDAIIQEEGI